MPRVATTVMFGLIVTLVLGSVGINASRGADASAGLREAGNRVTSAQTTTTETPANAKLPPAIQVVPDAKKWAIATGHPDATAAGLAVLRDGGNVVDAAVAASLTLGVAEPYGSGLGGKLVLLYHDAKTGKVSCIEALCASAEKTDPDEFAALSRNERRYGYRSVCVPGLPAGIFAAHQKWGSKPWKTLVAPAAKLARDGVVVSRKMQQLFAPHQKDLVADPEASRLYLINQQTPAVGARLPNADLAATLERFAEQGAAGFYQGATAERIVAAAQAVNAPLTIEDFATYQARFSEPLTISYRGYRVSSSPPPLTGGVTVLSVLKAHEAFDIPRRQPRNARYINQLGRTLQVLYPRISNVIADTPTAADQARQLISEDSIQSVLKASRLLEPVPQDANLQSHSVGQVVAQLDSSQQAHYPKQANETLDDHAEASTTHLVVADAEGNMVSLTQSLSLHFGAAVIAPGTGVLLNDSMSNFATTWKASPNYIAGGKRPRSTVAPVIATRDGLPALALGIPGGQRIPTTTIQLIVDILGTRTPLDEAFERPRFHLRRPISSKQANNQIDLEADVRHPKQQAELRRELAEQGWDTETKPRNGSYFGGGNAIHYLPGGKMMAVGDTRRTNHAAGD